MSSPSRECSRSGCRITTVRLVFAHLDDVRALAPAGAADEGLRIRVTNVLAAPAVAARLRAALPRGYEVRDWTQDNANYFRAIRIEKTMMSLILLLIVAVAAFNIVAMLVMVVTDKRTDIAILRTFGASPRRVMGVFITQGLVIGWLGVALGVALGLHLAFNIEQHRAVPRAHLPLPDPRLGRLLQQRHSFRGARRQRGGDIGGGAAADRARHRVPGRCARPASRRPKRCATSSAWGTNG